MKNYWIFKHKPGQDGADNCQEFVEKAIHLNSGIMEYEYDIYDSSTVTRNWNQARKVQPNDVIFLCDDHTVYAAGKAIFPRKEANITLSASEAKKYNSHNYKGIIHFDPQCVFYEDLTEGEENWGQRIDVDSWKYYSNDGIQIDESQLQDKSDVYCAIRKMKNIEGEKLLKQLQGDFMNSDNTNILLHTKNIILHGAPGTGKTHLAKQMALKILFGKDNEKLLSDEEKKEMKERIGFVQFHPSYDYTDFVEGLRPINDNDSDQIGFERKDGIFKSFCAKALENLNNSKKNMDILKKEISFEKAYNTLVEKIQNEEIKTITLKNKKEREIINADETKIILKTPNSNSPYAYVKVYFNVIKKLSEYFPEPNSLNSITNINESFRGKNVGGDTSALWGVLNKIYEQKDTKELENISIIQKKDFVFIIDEINRGEISKIFGELFFSIDPGYRGVKGKIKTQYANLQDEANEFDKALNVDEDNYGHFFVPENVYIIGTMNDIDRSVDSMDFAFRRRFTFCEIKANKNLGMLDELDESIRETAKNKLLRLNDEISKIEGLSDAYHIGGAYFLKLKELNNNFEDLWKYHLKGLLSEYLRGMEKSEDKLKQLYNAYNPQKADEGNNIDQDTHE